EALVDGEAEDEWIAARKAGEQRNRGGVIEAEVLADPVPQRGAVAALRRFVRELLDVVRPHLLGAEAALRDGLDAIADLCARVAVDRPLQRALVVVDEETRGHDRSPSSFLALEELQCPRNRVGGARAQLALVVAGRETVAEVHLRRQSTRQLRRRFVAIVALVRDVANPAEALDAHWARSLVAC